ncbi:MAG: hypothetical protein VKN72_27545 [Nostocales cyanobacterium 94392]|nr:hypothetical protein [Nostocales cyanobacterium 94392]
MIQIVPFFRCISSIRAASFVVFLTLSTASTTPAVAASLFDFNFEGTLTGLDPLGTAATERKLEGSFVLDADTVNNSPTPIAGRYDGAIKDLNLTFASTVNDDAVKFNASDFEGTTNRLFVGARGTQEEFQFLFGNVASRFPFFQPKSVGIIFTGLNLPLTTQLKEVLIPSSTTFNGEFKLTLSPDQVNTPNNLFSGSITITPSRIPEPANILGLTLLPLGLLHLSYLNTKKATLKNVGN